MKIIMIIICNNNYIKNSKAKLVIYIIKLVSYIIINYNHHNHNIYFIYNHKNYNDNNIYINHNHKSYYKL